MVEGIEETRLESPEAGEPIGTGGDTGRLVEEEREFHHDISEEDGEGGGQGEAEVAFDGRRGRDFGVSVEEEFVAEDIAAQDEEEADGEVAIPEEVEGRSGDSGLDGAGQMGGHAREDEEGGIESEDEVMKDDLKSGEASQPVQIANFSHRKGVFGGGVKRFPYFSKYRQTKFLAITGDTLG